MKKGFFREVTVAWTAGIFVVIAGSVWTAVSDKGRAVAAWVGRGIGAAWGAICHPVSVPFGLVAVAAFVLGVWAWIVIRRFISPRAKLDGQGGEAAMRALEGFIVNHLTRTQTWVQVTQVIDAANLPDALTTGALDRLYKRGSIRYKNDALNGTCVCLSAIGIAYAKKLGLVE